MIFLTAGLLGLCAGLTRSAFSIAFVAVLMLAAFALASGLSAAPTHYLNLLSAVLGYNAALISLVAGLSLTRRSSEA